MHRILDIADSAASLHVRLRQLIIRPAEGDEVSTPLAEVAAVVVSNPRVVITQAVVAGLAEHGGTLVVCGTDRLPAAMMLPLQAHVTQTERFALQVAMSLPARKRLWAQIVRAKISAQGRLLAALHGDDGGLAAMSRRVRSGDSGHLESAAAQRYWPRLFADPSFRRAREGPGQNPHLNYGYAVLRALTARALCGAGLHPSLGLNHHNRYDPFCLANDLMEPFRPVVDRAVFEWVSEHGSADPLDRVAKAALIAPLTQDWTAEGASRSPFDWLARAASSLAAALSNPSARLLLPEV